MHLNPAVICRARFSFSGPYAISVTRYATRSSVEGHAIFQLADPHRTIPRGVPVSSHLQIFKESHGETKLPEVRAAKAL